MTQLDASLYLASKLLAHPAANLPDYLQRAFRVDRPTSTSSPIELRHDFLRLLHPDGFHDVRGLKAGERAKLSNFRSDNLIGVDEFADRYQNDRDIYVGVSPRATATGRAIGDCLALHALFADLDSPRALEQLAAFPLEPSIIVASGGGGLHVYWLLTEPLDLRTKAAVAYAKQLLSALQRALAADPNSAEPAHILRLPGTLNHKYDPPRPVVVEAISEFRRYPLADIVAFLPPLVVDEPEDATPISHGLALAVRMRFARTWLERQPAGYAQGYRPTDPVQNGNTETYKISCAVAVGHDLTVDEALEAMRDWNARCDPPWPEHELREQIRGAVKYAKGPRGAKLDFRRKGKHIDAASIDNTRLALAKLGVELRFNLFAQKSFVEQSGQPTLPLDDQIANALWVATDDRFGFRPSKDLLRTVLDTEAARNAWHPVRDYLDGLEWDGTPRIDAWLITYGKAKDSPLVRAVSSIVLIAAVRRVREPGCKFDELLILESKQGLDKSTALRTLCPNGDWFSDSLQLGAHSKEVVEETGGKWIVEASELVGNKKEAERLKGFLSRQVDGPARLAYAHYSSEVPRQFVIIGTTNKDVYLKDWTGNRRFWAVPVQLFDVAALRRDRDQLWAEAAHREAERESIRLDRSLWDAAEQEQKLREIMHPWMEILGPCFAKPVAYRVDPKDLWEMLQVPIDRRRGTDAETIAAIMQYLGFKRMAVRPPGGEPVWGWGREGDQLEFWKPA